MIGPLVKFDDVIFEINSAYNGGGLYFAPIGKENQIAFVKNLAQYNNISYFEVVNNVQFLNNKAQYMGGAAQFLFEIDPNLFTNLILTGNQAPRGNDLSTTRPVAVHLRVYQTLVDLIIDETTNLTEWVKNKSRTVSS